MKVSEIQTAIFEQTNLKTTVRKGTGSMKNHYSIRPLFQGGEYAKYPYEWLATFKTQFKGFGHGVFATAEYIDIPILNFTEYDPIQYKKERKPKPIDQSKTTKGWGSKNSQLRLDKAAARYGKALRRGEDRAKYY